MPYQLHEDLSFCQVDDHLVFLDTRKDRYFRLSTAMERAFLACTEGNDAHEVASVLIKRGILIDAICPARVTPTHPVACPTRSAIERSPSAIALLPSVFIDVFSIVCSTRLQLATVNLGNVLTKLINYRRAKALPDPKILTDRDAEHLSDVVVMFWRARSYVPIAPRCLLDSLALVRFLAKRGQHSNIIFGVTSDPFAAHAWVQIGDIVLSDTLGHATAHTPIRVV